MEEDQLIPKLEDTKRLHLELDQKMDSLLKHIQLVRADAKQKYAAASEGTRYSQFSEEEFESFLKKPYTILPARKSEWFVIVPKFINMHVGWLDHSDASYNIFRVNKFISWLGEIPKDLAKQFKFKDKLPLNIYDGMLLTGAPHQEEAWNRYKKFLSRREGKDKIKVKRGREFDLIASLLDDGIMPFIPKAVETEDINPDFDHQDLFDWQQEIWLRDYVQKGLEKFLEYGAVGIYWAFSAGKSVFGSIMCRYIKGPKLVVVPTRMLVEQWEQRLHDMGVYDVTVITYASAHKHLKEEWVLIVFDECHRLPANTYSKLSTIQAKYRIGLSATPYREDGRTDYIFALTGFPIGLDWSALLELGIIEPPDIRLYVLKDKRAKSNKLAELLQTPMKTLVFCDSLSLGNQLSKRLEIPFISGKSSKRLEVIQEAETCIVSRVGDEGVSLPDIQRVIEIDFLFGSRRQEGQRLGRLFHGEKKGMHIILMTEEELERYGKRLYSIHEKGFKIEIIR